MKSRNYLLVLLSLTITGMPALAVDYIACREMLRTKNEFIEISNQYETMKIETQRIYRTTKDKNDGLKCLDIPNGFIDKSIPIKDWKEGEDIPALRMPSSPIFVCLDRVSERQNTRRNQGETKSRGLYFNFDEGHYYYKKALRQHRRYVERCQSGVLPQGGTGVQPNRLQGTTVQLQEAFRESPD